jgi:hypothetical protein
MPVVLAVARLLVVVAPERVMRGVAVAVGAAFALVIVVVMALFTLLLPLTASAILPGDPRPPGMPAPPGSPGATLPLPPADLEPIFGEVAARTGIPACLLRAIAHIESGYDPRAVGRGATSDGSILAGQNLDQHPLNRELLIVLRVEPEAGPAQLMCTFAGLVGYPGLNHAGVTAFQNALSTPVWRGDGMPHYLLKRVLLEQTDLAGCLSVAGRAAVCSSANYVLTDRVGMIDVEMTPDGLATVDAEDDLLVHTNHFLSPALTAREALLPNLPDSACRAPRMAALLRAQRGRITVDTLKEALADHDNHPTGICRHQEQMVTIAAMIAEPDQGRLHVAAGNPCAQAFVTYAL